MLAGMLAGPAFFKRLPPHHGLMGWYPDYFLPYEEELQDIKNAIFESLTIEEQLAFYLGQVVDQGIRPRVSAERLVSYKSVPWGNFERIVDYDLISQEAGDVPPDTTWREDLRCAAGEVGIRLPHALVPERTGSPPLDSKAIVRQVDEHIRSALLGSLPDSHPSEAVNPQARQRPPRSEREVDPKDTTIDRYQASDGDHSPAAGTPTPPKRLVVTRNPPRATLGDEEFNLTDEQAAFLDILNRDQGHWVAPEVFEKDPLSADTRRDRILKSLPKPLGEIIQSKRGSGYKMR
jgi:hypothetical protein